MINRRTLVSRAAALGVPAVLGSPLARAQATVKQLTIVVAFPAGGATDAVARLVGEGLRGRYADVVIVDNRVGGNGRTGAEAVKNGPPDGSMMLFTPAFPMVIFPHIYKNLSYDVFRDFVPVATTSKGMLALSIGPAVPASVKTMQDFIAWCRANPDKANYGAPAGGGQHFAGALFAKAANIPFQMIAYKGGAPATVDLLGGHIAASINPLPEIMPHVAEGKLRVLATTGAARSRFLPDVPTMTEFGYKDVVFQDWSGFLAPARTPRDIVAKANAAVNEVVRSQAGAAGLGKVMTEPDSHTPESFATMNRAVWERYRDVVAATGFKVDE